MSANLLRPIFEFCTNPLYFLIFYSQYYSHVVINPEIPRVGIDQFLHYLVHIDQLNLKIFNLGRRRESLGRESLETIPRLC